MQAQAAGSLKNSTVSSFIGLQSYTEDQAAIFFGRDKETESLTKLVQSNTLTIVFGKSGTGKTSLLNAGVFPKLRKDYCLPFRVRLEFRENSPDLITQLKRVLKEEIDKYGFKVEAYPSTETLWEYFHIEPLWKSITPILIFDQFEEIFTLAKKNDRFGNSELAMFWEELSDLIENSIPEKLKDKFLNHKEQINYSYKEQKIKILFSFREEYLPEFESITTKIPSLKYSRFRLLPMNGHQAYEVITKTWKNDINPTEANQIVSFFTNDTNNDSYDLITLEPSLLSQVCSYIDKERIKEGGNKVSAELLKKYPKETILRSIYNETITESNEALKSDLKGNEQTNPVKEFLEEKLITTEGYRTKYSLTEHEETIRPGIEVLKNKYFIREDDNTVELTHDALTPVIKSDREKRRKEAALALEKKKARKKVLIILIVALLSAIGFWGLAKIQRDKAISQRDEAKFEERKLKDSILSHNLTIKNLLDTIKGKKNILKSFEKGGDTSNAFSGDTSALNQIMDSLFHLKKISEDVLKIEIRILKDTIIEHKIRIRKLLLERQVLLKSDSITLLTNQLNEFSIRLADTEKKYEVFKAENETLRRELLKRQKTIDSLRQILGNVSLKGKLFYDKEGEAPVKPSNVTLFLIPKRSNRNVVRNASVYEITCYEKELNEAQGRIRTTTDNNGNYVFRNVPNGEYLLKICTYYGGFYTVKVSDSKKPMEINFNASPPIRYPYTN